MSERSSVSDCGKIKRQLPDSNPRLIADVDRAITFW